jgi:UDP-N-acetyl-D-mannosaminuronic acid dehydrogenase
LRREGGNPNLNIVIVGGCGHVGLPLGLVFADVGHSVIAYDVSESAVEQINSGKVPFMEYGAADMLTNLLKKGNFTATVSPKCISEAEVVIIVIGTPVDEYLSPNPNSVVDVILDIKEYLNPNQLLLLRSTVFPGVSKRVESMLSEQIPGISVAYCPERIVEGKAIEELKNLPQIIGARDNSSFGQACALFESLQIKTIRVTPEEAELAKLFTNVWRYIKFATANQFFMMANDLGVDYEIVRNAISFEYPRAADLPKSGFAAGPCLFKDTMQLSALVQQNFPLGNSAMMINEGMPGYLVSKLEKLYDLSSMTIGILGMAFKADIDDTRSSLAYKLRKLLMFKAKEVLISDPYVKDSKLISEEDVLEKSDLLIIGAPHTHYQKLKTNKPVIDIWGLLGKGVLIE